jgi:hypothetical protein
MTPLGIDPTTFGLAAQYLNQLRHPLPRWNIYLFMFIEQGLVFRQSL